jgi:hypothetical protein
MLRRWFRQEAQFELNSFFLALIDVGSAATVFCGFVACSDAARTNEPTSVGR